MKKNKYEIIGVDFDDTLAITKDIYPEIGEPIQEVLDYILDRQEHGAFLILITMREGAALKKAVKWSKEQGIFFDAVNDNLQHMKNHFQNNPRKIFCTEYLDDHNIGGIETVIEQIKKKGKNNE